VAARSSALSSIHDRATAAARLAFIDDAEGAVEGLRGMGFLGRRDGRRAR